VWRASQRTPSTPRAAPPGVWAMPLRPDRPPDGWEVLSPTAGQEALVRLDAALLRFADTAARGITRRGFLKGLGQLGLLLGLTTTGMLWGTELARAHPPACDLFDDPGDAPCGPSPICDRDLYCNDNGNCQANRGDTEKRTYGGGSCCSSTCSGTDNCWREHCCGHPNWNSHVRCCDCCAPSAGVDCTGSGCPNNRCICRSKVGATC
jgi:hypothetical protein